MKSIAYLVKELREKGIQLRVTGENLEISHSSEEIDAHTLSQLKDHKEELLTYLKSFNTNKSFVQIPRVEEAESYPISDAQKRLWVLCQFEESSVAYNIPSQIKLDGSYDLELFKKAIYKVVQRHEILRTVFKEDATGEIRQWIIPFEDLQFEIGYHDFKQGGITEANTFMEKDTLQPFHLDKGPLFRAALLQITRDQYVFYYNMHHIISDGWSMQVLANDVFTFYEKLKEEKEPVLPQLKIQYRDYTVWQLAQLENEESKTHKAYWKDLFRETITPISLPSSKKRPSLKTNTGATLTMLISEDIGKALKTYTQDQGGTIFMGLLAVLKSLLYRYTFQKDLVVGTAIAGREHADLKNQIGFYVNTLALRNVIAPEDSFNTFFRKVKENTLNAYRHQNYPFDRLVEDLDIKRNVSRNPVFDIMMIFQNLSEDIQVPEEESNALNQVVPKGKSAPKFDIDIDFQMLGDQLHFELSYNSDVYEDEMMQSFMNHFRQLLVRVLENPETKIKNVDFLTQEEKAELLFDFNKTKAAYPRYRSIIKMFAEQVHKTPDFIAIITEKQRLTYYELNKISDRYAAYLSKILNVKKGDNVVVLLDHDEHLMPVLLAIKKIGAVYVPVDPKTPKSRVDYIIKDSNSTAFIDGIAVDDMASWNAFENDGFTYNYNEDHDIEFIIYTSGSTGYPKGVLITSSGVNNRLNWMWNKYPFTEGEVCCAKTSISFVDHIWELYGPLLQGIPLVFYKKEQLLDIPSFIKSLYTHQVSRIVLVPSLLKEIISHRELAEESLAQLKIWISSGEVLRKSDVEKFYSVFHSKDVRLINIYGSTEVTADATYYDTYDEYNKYKDFALFEHSAKERIDKLISSHEYSEKIVASTWEELLEDSDFLRVSSESDMTIDAYLDFLHEKIVPNTVNVGATSFVGHMASRIPAIFREINALVVTLNQNQVKIETSMVSTLIERQVIGIFHNLVYQNPPQFYSQYVQSPNNALGVVTNGGTMSNLMALNYALNNALGPKAAFQGVKKEGLVKALDFYGYKGIVLLGSSWCHYSFDKALKFMGLGQDAFVPLDFEGKTDKEIREELNHTITRLQNEKTLVLGIVGIAGATESGNIDPLVILGEKAKEFGIHYHIDAAFGGGFLVEDTLRKKFEGIALAHSVSICAHKQFYMPIGLSVCLFKDPSFANASENNTHYQARKGSYDLGRFTVEGSRNFMSLMLHAAFRVLGKEGFAQVIRHNYTLAQEFARMIEEHQEFELLYRPDLNIVLYRYIPIALRGKRQFTEEELLLLNDLNRKIQKEQFNGGDTFVSYTKIKQAGNHERHLVFRAVFMNPYTNRKDLSSVLEEQRYLAAKIENRPHLPAKLQHFENVSIGKPIENVKVYILDSSLNLLPVGVTGEICISGDCVSAGYLHSISENTGQFIENPFVKGERLFRTGDMGRRLSDGNIEFMGRKDDQIKIRGNRVEPGEIEKCLLEKTEIKQVAVKARTNESQENELVAYIVSEVKENPAALKKLLGKDLPEYMLPAYFVQLDAFPLLVNGKLDKKALPDPDSRSFRAQQEYIPPSTETEEKIVTIWQEVLQIHEPIGVEDDFFELGGHSIKATKVLSKINREFDVEINIKNLFVSPTIKNLASQINFLKQQEKLRSKTTLNEISL
ncbi:condensation domain-containing protein [Ascidiimonas aurantiaca]|uniref:condensation domain-containing protein n=1 Tax=Ascidiimonas aurantiaca TaxID=1685432 RepID=UPI0030ECEC49